MKVRFNVKMLLFVGAIVLVSINSLPSRPNPVLGIVVGVLLLVGLLAGVSKQFWTRIWKGFNGRKQSQVCTRNMTHDAYVTGDPFPKFCPVCGAKTKEDKLFLSEKWIFPGIALCFLEFLFFCVLMAGLPQGLIYLDKYPGTERALLYLLWAVVGFLTLVGIANMADKRSVKGFIVCGNLTMVLIFLTLYASHGSARYSMEYGVQTDRVQIALKPHNCEFMTAPLGDKGCHYVRDVEVQTGDSGNPVRVYVGWQKEEE